MADDWLFKPMEPSLAEIAATKAREFEKLLQSASDGVLEGNGTHNDIFSIYAHVLSVGIAQMVEDMRRHAAQLPDGRAGELPIEAALGILLNDTMSRFWIARRLPDSPPIG